MNMHACALYAGVSIRVFKCRARARVCVCLCTFRALYFITATRTPLLSTSCSLARKPFTNIADRHPAEKKKNKKSQVIAHAIHSSSIFAMNLAESVAGESECSIK